MNIVERLNKKQDDLLNRFCEGRLKPRLIIYKKNGHFVQVFLPSPISDKVHYEFYESEGKGVFDIHLERNNNKSWTEDFRRELLDALEKRDDLEVLPKNDGWHWFRVKNENNNIEPIVPSDDDETIINKVVAGFEEIIRTFEPIILNYRKTQMDKDMEIMEALLKMKRNLILTGAPGVGKTYTTAELALRILGVKDVELDNHTEVMKKYKELQDGKRIFFTTFHQSLDYEDFVEGLKPKLEKGNITYEVGDGIFKQACQAVHSDECIDIVECIDDYLQKINGKENKREIPTKNNKPFYVWYNGKKSLTGQSKESSTGAVTTFDVSEVIARAKGEQVPDTYKSYEEAFIDAVKREGKKVVLIIDEINRGNVSKIFGELITLIESDKREGEGGEHPLSAILPYSKSQFSVPSNLYIIGTMNTTDRSTGTLDYALRRRFAFFTLSASEDYLTGTALSLFNKVKNFIEKNTVSGDYDINDLMVGHSYFMAKEECGIKAEEVLDYKMKYEVIPLLKEYINDGIIKASMKQLVDTFPEYFPKKGTETGSAGN